MMKPLLAALALLAVLPTATAQTPTNGRSEEIMKKVRQLDALIQIVPLALTKDQITPLLAAIEKTRQNQRELETLEAKDLTTLDADLSKVVDDGINKNVYPPRETSVRVKGLFQLMAVRRAELYDEAVGIVFAACKANLNEGQLKLMEKSLKPGLLDPSIKVAEMDSDAKIKFFVRKVILDPAAYDVLVKMSQRKEEPETPPTPPAIPQGL